MSRIGNQSGVKDGLQKGCNVLEIKPSIDPSRLQESNCFAGPNSNPDRKLVNQRTAVIEVLRFRTGNWKYKYLFPEIIEIPEALDE